MKDPGVLISLPSNFNPRILLIINFAKATQRLSVLGRTVTSLSHLF